MREWRSLLAITLGVVAIHAVVLQRQDVSLRVGDAGPLRVMTRVIETASVASAVSKSSAAALTPALSQDGRGSNPSTNAPLARTPQSRASTLPEPSLAASPSVSETASPNVASQPQTIQLAVSIPASARLPYKLTTSSKGRIAEGDAELTWRHDGATYEAKLEVNSPFVPKRIQTSTGAITSEGLAPTRFSDRYRGEQATHFDRTVNKVTFSSNTPATDLSPGSQDRLSVMLQVASIVAGDPGQFKPGATITIATATTRDSSDWLFVVEGHDTLALPAGNIDVLKIKRTPKRDYDQLIELWLAPGMAYAPVRLRLTNANGDWTDQQWSGADRP